MPDDKHIIVAVLHWGLGHATRSIQIIDALLQAGYTPVLASDGQALELLKRRYPALPSASLPAYNIRYKSGQLISGLVPQLLGLMGKLRKEQRLIEVLVDRYKAKAVISDNRLTAYSKRVPSVYISHQLQLEAGLFSALATRLHRQFIRKFQFLWIPDLPRQLFALAGKLSQLGKLSLPHAHLGWLSQFHWVEPTDEEQRYALCIILSGPEPARSEWEAEILRQATSLREPILLIRGNQKAPALDLGEHIESINLANAADILRGIAQSKRILSRSGYSSIMDYLHLKRGAFLVPTPGQSEQEYLAKHLSAHFPYSEQGKFDLRKVLEWDGAFKGEIPKNEAPNWPTLFRLFEGE